jgi:hypothetical protein
MGKFELVGYTIKTEKYPVGTHQIWWLFDRESALEEVEKYAEEYKTGKAVGVYVETKVFKRRKPAAWQRRLVEDGEVIYDWQTCTEKQAKDIRESGEDARWQVRPLFAS